MITIEDITHLSTVFAGARRYAGETKDVNYLSQLIQYEKDLSERMEAVIKKPKKQKK